jgi:multidrug efflux pump subunit AcrA (membrane-fusion protein)
MKILDARKWIASILTVLILTGGYIIYRIASTPDRLGTGPNERPPRGRAYTVQKGTMSIGLNAKGKVVRGYPDASVQVDIAGSSAGSARQGQQTGIWIIQLAKSFKGNVAQISKLPAGQDGNTAHRFNVSIINGKSIVKGMDAEVQIITDIKQNVIYIPSYSVVQGKNNQPYVWLIPPTQNGKYGGQQPILWKIETGIGDERNTEVTQGLKEGDIILLPASQD